MFKNGFSFGLTLLAGHPVFLRRLFFGLKLGTLASLTPNHL
jgi:hypothetical protein